MKKIFIALLMSLAFTQTTNAQAPENTTIKIGQKAPNLKFDNPAGQPIELAKINKDHIVLVDFWASWCRPCRGANPGLVALYNKYKDQKFKLAKQGFIVLSVSLDQNKAAWEKAIKDDKLVWEYHMSDLGGWNSKAAEMYGVQFIPQAFLVGPDGKIIGKYNFGEEAEADLHKMLK